MARKTTDREWLERRGYIDERGNTINRGQKKDSKKSGESGLMFLLEKFLGFLAVLALFWLIDKCTGLGQM